MTLDKNWSENMDQPLTIWYCDICGEKITNISDGYVIWKRRDGKSHDFKIIHTGTCDPRMDYPCSSALEDFLGADGLQILLYQLGSGTIMLNLNKGSHCSVVDSMDEFVDFFRRVQTPYYEQARRCFNNPELLEFYNDSNEVRPYMEDALKHIIEKYS